MNAPFSRNDKRGAKLDAAIKRKMQDRELAIKRAATEKPRLPIEKFESATLRNAVAVDAAEDPDGIQSEGGAARGSEARASDGVYCTTPIAA